MALPRNEQGGGGGVLDPRVWGPPMWFVIHTVARSYPERPNAITKKKYYEWFQNLPLFLPVQHVSVEFSRLLDTYPVSSYLDNRNSLMRWTHFIHNQVRASLQQPLYTYEEACAAYAEAYRPKRVLPYRAWMAMGALAVVGMLYGWTGQG